MELRGVEPLSLQQLIYTSTCLVYFYYNRNPKQTKQIVNRKLLLPHEPSLINFTILCSYYLHSRAILCKIATFIQVTWTYAARAATSRDAVIEVMKSLTKFKPAFTPFKHYNGYLKKPTIIFYMQYILINSGRKPNTTPYIISLWWAVEDSNFQAPKRFGLQPKTLPVTL